MAQIKDLKSFVEKVVDRETDAKQVELAEYAKTLEDKLQIQKDQLTAKHESKVEKVDRQLEEQFNIRLNSLQLAQRNDRLAIKQAIIDDYVTEVKAGFKNLSSENIHTFIEALLSKHTELENPVIVLGEQTKALLKESVNTFPVGVSEKTLPNQSGFILMDGDIEYNYLFDNLVEESRRQLQLILVDNVFNQEK